MQDNRRNPRRKAKKAPTELADTFWAYKRREVSVAEDCLVLLDNVQFIYELALAQLELQALGIDFEVTNSLREFRALGASNFIPLIRKSAYFKQVGRQYTDYFHIIQRNRTRSVNQYLTHWIYPYKGKFHPQMIRALLNIIGLSSGDTVLDPFIGSGTTAVEAELLGINCIGIDISPLCVLQSRVKTDCVEAFGRIEALHREVTNKVQTTVFAPTKDAIWDAINAISDEKARDFYKMAFLVAISDVARRRKDFSKSFLANLDRMIKSVRDFAEISRELGLRSGNMAIQAGDARDLSLEEESIDGIITSPPYSIALDYVSNDAHALQAMGYFPAKMRDQFMGVRGKGPSRLQLYNEDMMKSYNEMYRVLKPEKSAVIVIGNATYMRKEVKTVEFTIDYCENLGFKLIRNIDKIIFGLYNVMRKENILIFHKPHS